MPPPLKLQQHKIQLICKQLNRELIDANKEVTTNYQVVKKNYDFKRREYEELSQELEEAKNACQLALVTLTQ